MFEEIYGKAPKSSATSSKPLALHYKLLLHSSTHVCQREGEGGERGGEEGEGEGEGGREGNRKEDQKEGGARDR